MAKQDWPPENQSEGQASLSVATAYLSTLLGAVDALDGRAMFLAAVNVALYTLFAGLIVEQVASVWVWLPGFVVLVIVLGLTWDMLRPRETRQFTPPEELLENRFRGYDDHAQAWEYVEVIRLAAEDTRKLLERKELTVRLMAVASAIHGLTLVVGALL